MADENTPNKAENQENAEGLGGEESPQTAEGQKTNPEAKVPPEGASQPSSTPPAKETAQEKATRIKAEREAKKAEAEAKKAEEEASKPESPVDQLFTQLREDFVYHHGGIGHKLKAGLRLSSLEYPLPLLHKRGAKLDIIDLETGTVVGDYADHA